MFFKTRCWKLRCRLQENILRKDWKIQAIHWLWKLFGNFHSSTVLLCLCVQEESHGRRRPQPPLADPAPPSPFPPAPPCKAGLLFGWARDEPVGVRAREPGSLPWAGLDRVIPHIPGPGWVKDRPQRLLLQWVPLFHAAWDTAGADLLRDEGEDGWLQNKEQLLKSTEPQHIGLDQATQGRL